MNPTKGRIVLYTVSEGRQLPAIVTDTRIVKDTDQSPEYLEICATIFDTQSFHFATWIRQGDAPNQWNWPVREAAPAVSEALVSGEKEGSNPSVNDIVAAVVAALKK